MTFEDFVKYLYQFYPLETHKNLEGILWPQYKTVFDDQNKEYNMDFVGRYENLQDDFEKVCIKLGIVQGALFHIPQISYSHYTTQYTAETKHMVAKLYEQDVELFKYKFVIE